jgi:hypothetical protein
MESNEGSIQIDDGSNWVKPSPIGLVIATRWAWGENISPLHKGSSTLCAIDKWRSPFSSVHQEYYVLIGQRVAGNWKKKSECSVSEVSRRRRVHSRQNWPGSSRDDRKIGVGVVRPVAGIQGFEPSSARSPGGRGKRQVV